MSSATYDQVKAAYFTMKEDAEKTDDGSVYWKGALTTKLEENGIPKSRYSVIVKFLVDMGCIESIRRGAGHVPSVWQLWKDPEWEDFENVKLSRNPGRMKASQQAGIQQQINDLNSRLLLLEARLNEAGVPEAEANLTIDDLEDELDEDG